VFVLFEVITFMADGLKTLSLDMQAHFLRRKPNRFLAVRQSFFFNICFLQKMAELGICESVVKSLMMASPTQTQIIGNVGSLQIALDPENQRGVEVVSHDKGDGFFENVGGTPSVKLRYYPPSIDTTESSFTCNNPSTPAYIDTTFALTLQSWIKPIAISRDYMRLLCGEATTANNSWLQGVPVPLSIRMNEVRNMIMSRMRDLFRTMNTNIRAKILASFGNNAVTGNATSISIPLFKADGTLRADGWAKAMVDYMTNEFTGQPLVLGGSLPNQYALSANNWASLSASGIDYEKLKETNPIKMYHDSGVDTVFGTGQMAVIAPGQIKFVQERKNVGVFAGKHANSYYGTFALPEMPEIVFDVQIQEIDCDTPSGSYKIMIGTKYDLFVMPSVFPEGDIKEGVNGVFRYTGTQAG
jgi:hypothetical protein